MTSAPVPRTDVDYCLGYGLDDSTECLYTLLATPGYLKVPIPNFVYYVKLHYAVLYQVPLTVGPGTVFDGNNCTFYGNSDTPYYYDPVIGWYETSVHNGGANYGQLTLSPSLLLHTLPLCDPVLTAAPPHCALW